jgi:uncharacterized protein YeaO (DUF488 family)
MDMTHTFRGVSPSLRGRAYSRAARSTLIQLREMVAREHVTLVFATHDAELSNAAILCDILRQDERE